MNNYEERIKKYSEELELVEKGLVVYAQFGNNKKVKSIEHYKVASEELALRNKKSKLIATRAQLIELMKQAEEDFKKDLIKMKGNFKDILKKACDLDIKGDQKRLVMAFKNKDVGKSWLSDKHKLHAYKLLLNLVNENSNGKAI